MRCDSSALFMIVQLACSKVCMKLGTSASNNFIFERIHVFEISICIHIHPNRKIFIEFSTLLLTVLGNQTSFAFLEKKILSLIRSPNYDVIFFLEKKKTFSGIICEIMTLWITVAKYLLACSRFSHL